MDVYVGKRARSRRIELGLTMEAVADAIGVHYQQIQRYETGSVRVSAARLWALAKVLGVRIDYFFDGFEEGAATSDPGATDGAEDAGATDQLALLLLRSFRDLREDEKQAVFSIVKSMAEKSGSFQEE